MKHFTLFLFIACCFANVNAQLLCNATIGFQQNPNTLGADLWADNFTGDTANTTFTWQFCDGSVDSGLSIVHAIPFNGTPASWCLVCLTITNTNNGCSNTVCDSVRSTGSIANPCGAYATFTNVDSLYTFFASTTGGLPVVYEWSVNGTTVDTTPSVTFVLDSTNAVNGGTLVCVTIIDASGCMSTDCIAIGNNNGTPIGGTPCQAYFVIHPDTGANTGGLPGYYIGENRSSGNYGSDILWDFGDGSTSTDPYPVHNYAVPGNYIVCLTVGVAGTNCYDTYCDSSFYVFKTEGGLMSHLAISSPTGISDVEEIPAFKIFPNPVTNELNWLPENKVEQVRIFDLSGRKVLEAKTTGTRLNLAKLCAGTYFIQASTKDGRQLSIRKLVKE